MSVLFLLLASLLQLFSCSANTESISADTVPQTKKDPNVVILGDSNSSIGGDSCDIAKGWTKWFRDIAAPATCLSYARSGATWSNTTKTIHDEMEKTALLSDNNVIFNQACRLLSAYDEGLQPMPDIIVIAAGTNDAWFSKRRPHALDAVPSNVLLNGDSLSSLPPSSLLTVAEAVSATCALLKSRFPSAKIILLTPLQCTATSLERINKIGDIIESCGNLLNIPVIRQDVVCPIRRQEEIVQHKYTSDGTHTNSVGAEANARVLAPIIMEFF